MTTYKQYIEIEIQRCKKNLQTIQCPERRMIIKSHIKKLRISQKRKIIEMDNSVYVPENVAQNINTMYQDDRY